MTIIEFSDMIPDDVYNIEIHHDLQRYKREELETLGIKVIDQHIEYRSVDSGDLDGNNDCHTIWTFTVDSDDMVRSKLLNPNSHYIVFGNAAYPIRSNGSGHILFYGRMLLERIYDNN